MFEHGCVSFVNVDVFYVVDINLVAVHWPKAYDGDVVLHRGKHINVLEADIAGIEVYSQEQLQTATTQATNFQSSTTPERVHTAWQRSNQHQPVTLAKVCAFLL